MSTVKYRDTIEGSYDSERTEAPTPDDLLEEIDQEVTYTGRAEMVDWEVTGFVADRGDRS